MFTTSVLIASLAVASLQAPVVPRQLDLAPIVAREPTPAGRPAPLRDTLNDGKPAFNLEKVSVGEKGYYSVSVSHANPTDPMDNPTIICYKRFEPNEPLQAPLMCGQAGISTVSGVVGLEVTVQRPNNGNPWTGGVNFLFNWAGQTGRINFEGPLNEASGWKYTTESGGCQLWEQYHLTVPQGP